MESAWRRGASASAAKAHRRYWHSVVSNKLCSDVALATSSESDLSREEPRRASDPDKRLFRGNPCVAFGYAGYGCVQDTVSG
ncbi:MAG: hypothetical protein ACI9ZV_000537 [Candidatus Azotimanducaceae bacterium]|jgi:hypothetical protein